MSLIEVFVQVAGDPRTEIVVIEETANIESLVRAVALKALPVPADGGLVFVGLEEEPVAGSFSLEHAKVKHHSRVHIHHCKRIEVTVNFKEHSKEHHFAPSATVKQVLDWALKNFIKHGADQLDHVLEG